MSTEKDRIEPQALGAALRHAENGYRVFPCSPRDKRPLTPNGFHDATTDADTIRAWAEKHPGCLWGTPDGLVLDVDTHEGGADGYASYRELADEHGDGGGVSAETRSGGLHLWYSNPDTLPRKIGVRPGLDVCGDGGYAILWRDDLPPLSELPAPPVWIAELVRGRKNGDGPSEAFEGDTIPLGMRHKVFVAEAGLWRERDYNERDRGQRELFFTIVLVVVIWHSCGCPTGHSGQCRQLLCAGESPRSRTSVEHRDRGLRLPPVADWRTPRTQS